MLALEVGSPTDRELELCAILHGFLKDSDSIGVGQSLEFYSEHAAEPFDQPVIILVVEEGEVVHAVVKSVLDKVFDELLGEDHVVVNVVESHLGLDHPELCQVPWGVGVLRPEGWTESVDLTHGGGSELSLKLSAHGQTGFLSEKVFAEIHLAVVLLGDILEVEGRDLEHISGTLGIRLGDKGSVEIHESLVVEEFMDSERHCVADPQNSSEGVGPWTHVGYRTEILQGSVLLLERVSHRVAFAQNLDFLCLDLHGLSAADRLHQHTFDREARSGCHLGDKALVEIGHVGHHLDIMDSRSIVEGDELDLFVSSLSPYPTFGQHFHSGGRLQQVFHLCSCCDAHFVHYFT